MAYTVQQQPAFTAMPAGTDWIYAVYDSVNNPSNRYKFKYIVEIYAGYSTGTIYVGMFKFSPNSTDRGIINISDILEQYFSSTNLGSIFTGIESSFKGVDNIAGSECPIHCIDKLSLNTNSCDKIKLRFGKEYSNYPNVSPSQYLNDVTIDELFTFNAVAYNNEAVVSAGNYGLDIGNWDNKSFYNLNNKSYLLTDAPANSIDGQFIGEDDYATLAFLAGDFGGSAISTPNVYNIAFFDAAGNTTGGTISTTVNAANGGKDMNGIGTIQNGEYHMQFIGVGIANFKGAGFTIPSDWASYTVTLFNTTGTTVQVSRPYNYFKQDADCKGFEKIRLTWLNKYGAWDYYNFTKKNIASTDITRVSYDKVKGNYNGEKFVKYGYERGRATLNNRAVQTMSLNSDWFRNDKEAAWLEQLFISPEVYIIKGYDVTDTAPADFGHYMIPVTVTNKRYDKYTEANDKVAQYNLDIEYAIDKRIQRG